MGNKFKLGDRVKCTDADYCVARGLPPNAAGVVTRLEGDGVPLVRWTDAGRDYYCRDSRMEPAPPIGACTNTPPPDAVFRPSHYARYAIEPITFIVANKLDFPTGNVIKYVLRQDAKNGLEDLRKARRYLDIMIEDVERRGRGETLKVETV